MTSVGSIDPWSAGDGCVPVDPDGSNMASAADAPTDPDVLPHPELLIGFLADFHAAAREPVPEPTRDTPQPTGPLPSRFAAFTPPDPDVFDEAADRLGTSAPLPVWPPVPTAEARVPVAAATAEPPSKQSRLRRLGRRG